MGMVEFGEAEGAVGECCSEGRRKNGEKISGLEKRKLGYVHFFADLVVLYYGLYPVPFKPF